MKNPQNGKKDEAKILFLYACSIVLRKCWQNYLCNVSYGAGDETVINCFSFPGIIKAHDYIWKELEVVVFLKKIEMKSLLLHNDAAPIYCKAVASIAAPVCPPLFCTSTLIGMNR